MDDSIGTSQWRAEADVIARDAPSRYELYVERDETVRPHPLAAFRPPSFLEKTAAAAQPERLIELLEELYLLNEECVDQRTREAEAYG
jgi:hypothetical protein